MAVLDIPYDDHFFFSETGPVLFMSATACLSFFFFIIVFLRFSHVFVVSQMLFYMTL